MSFSSTTSAPTLFSASSCTALHTSGMTPLSRMRTKRENQRFWPSMERARRSSGWKMMTNAITHTVRRLEMSQFTARRFIHCAITDSTNRTMSPKNMCTARVPRIREKSL